MSDERSTTGVDKQLGERVRQRRLELGISQEKLADVLGVTFQQVQKYEKGVNRIAASRLLAISKALDTRVSWLMNDSGEATARAKGDKRLAVMLDTDEGLELIEMFTGIASKATRRKVVDLVRVLVRGE